MENCFWAELEDQYKDNSLMVPSSWLSPSDALQYHCYNPAAVAPPWAPPFEGSPEERAATASRSHSEAEKRRRDRINAQLSTLRKLIPMSEKMDKAVLLGHAVEQIKEQSKRAKEVSKLSTIPTENDQVTIIDDHSNTDKESHIIQMKATICCDDRPELLSEINGAIKGLGLTVMEAEITGLGGRVNSSFVVCANVKNVCIASLKQSIKLALGRVVLSSGDSSYCVRSKRQRFFYPNNSY
ncbi:hypothetical protein ABFS82_06G065300 [Erythranthe guttata]|uniref:BHLH domain-containing protein n=1 Tax=Erythranthe guttata TaxID=4155 RepID=A0A022PX04_ERYGU|nr:PREDICTED: transcription factor bHLH51 [Erythranthe guttata]EYU20034.1 hypothetical protein MIMGU_mgv1a012796mg [Erythranthe guttata]|eukprot:XP_012858204.1 PREDICTED: transcription factor bHLH51 [Erythranthe guttata]